MPSLVVLGAGCLADSEELAGPAVTDYGPGIVAPVESPRSQRVGFGSLVGHKPVVEVEPTILAWGYEPIRLASAGASLFFADMPTDGTAQVMRVALGDNPALITRVRGIPQSIAVDDEAVYWTDTATGELWAAKTSGPASRLLVSAGGRPYALALRAGWVYFTDLERQTIERLDKDGGAATVLLAGQAQATSLAVTEEWLFWIDAASGSLFVAPTSGPSAMRELASSQTFTSGIVAAGDQVYWTDEIRRTVMRTSAMGGAVEAFASHQFLPRGIAVDETSVYWVTQADGQVKRMPRAGGPIAILATGDQPDEIVVDDGRVYWSDLGSALWTVAK
jgi:hypothetical protein